MIFKEEQNDNKELFDLLPYLEKYKTLNGKLTFYICKNGKCEKPSNNVKEIIEEVINHD